MVIIIYSYMFIIKTHRADDEPGRVEGRRGADGAKQREGGRLSFVVGGVVVGVVVLVGFVVGGFVVGGFDVGGLAVGGQAEGSLSRAEPRRKQHTADPQ